MKDFKPAKKQGRLHFQLSSMLLLITIIAILVAWYVDRSKLQAQIKPVEGKLAMIFRLSNASPNLVIGELKRLYPDQIFISGSSGITSGMNQSDRERSVIASIDQSLHDQIEIIIQYYDRVGTDMVEAAEHSLSIQEGCLLPGRPGQAISVSTKTNSND